MDKMEEGNVETQPHAKAEYKLPNPIIGKVPGTTEIVLVESISRHVGRFQNALPFYKGKVRCGDDDLGYGYGTGEHEGFVFLAFPWFQSTFMDFMDKSCKNTVDLERFSEDFIRLVTCIVYGLIELHSYNYYCPNLSGKQILVLKEHNSVFAKLWGFCPLELGNEKGKDMDWVRLGQILRKTAKNHKSYTIEIADLCERMMQGTLKGLWDMATCGTGVSNGEEIVGGLWGWPGRLSRKDWQVGCRVLLVQRQLGKWCSAAVPRGSMGMSSGTGRMASAGGGHNLLDGKDCSVYFDVWISVFW
ncbi:hypothetical protein PR202_ga22345 [Eleusine coracana subsp. coracana]|uniref:Uncharacterized protein n=1 Tax=Eleusine coracana subsp. coracana TaxID=191504 RepID=A0AAV5D341_ELECO|nr:hypothetical protein PR202_ga22345 [Eleusine coracana subsp. coracana]